MTRLASQPQRLAEVRAVIGVLEDLREFECDLHAIFPPMPPDPDLAALFQAIDYLHDYADLLQEAAFADRSYPNEF